MCTVHKGRRLFLILSPYRCHVYYKTEDYNRPIFILAADNIVINKSGYLNIRIQRILANAYWYSWLLAFGDLEQTHNTTAFVATIQQIIKDSKFVE